MKVKCKNCSKEVYKKPYALKTHTNVFCNSKCHYEYRIKINTNIVNCVNCGRKFRKTHSEVRVNNFCNKSCANVHNNKNIIRNYKDGNGSYRTRALREYGHKCSNKNCPIIKAGIKIPTYMLDVDHINSRKSGHDLKNLQVLCAWCHVKKTRNTLS